MMNLLQLTLAQKMAEANSQGAYVPSEIAQKNFFMDDAVIQRINSAKKDLDVFADMEDSEKSTIAMHMTYSNMKSEEIGNPFLKTHFESFKSEASFVGYYKKKMGLKLNVIG